MIINFDVIIANLRQKQSREVVSLAQTGVN